MMELRYPLANREILSIRQQESIENQVRQKLRSECVGYSLDFLKATTTHHERLILKDVIESSEELYNWVIDSSEDIKIDIK